MGLCPDRFSALDLGAGSGAWGKRLIAKGHKAKGVVLPSDLECVTGDLSFPFVETLDDFDATPKKIRTLGDLLKRATWIFRPLMRGHVGTQHIIMAGRPAVPQK